MGERVKDVFRSSRAADQRSQYRGDEECLSEPSEGTRQPSPDLFSSSSDGQTSQKLIACEYDESHHRHRQTALEAGLLDDPDA